MVWIVIEIGIDEMGYERMRAPEPLRESNAEQGGDLRAQSIHAQLVIAAVPLGLFPGLSHTNLDIKKHGNPPQIT